MIGNVAHPSSRRADRPEPDAFFALAGGPGRAGTAFFGWLPGLFADVHVSRDIVVVDQRHRWVECAGPAADARHDRPVAGKVDARLQTWSDDWLASIEADPRQYTSSVVADDLDDVREALGYELIDLCGPSCSATVAQYYIRQHPTTSGWIMDGGTPLDVHVFERMAANSQAALELLFDRCAADAACDAALPDVSAEWSVGGGAGHRVDTGLTDRAPASRWWRRSTKSPRTSTGASSTRRPPVSFRLRSTLPMRGSGHRSPRSSRNRRRTAATGWR